MTLTTADPGIAPSPAGSDRFRLNRAGILNVWQYDEQEFTLADGRMVLRGANGAGKSKTLEMLLPFALDGDKSRITASGRHHTSLLWLMTDGYEGQARVGYVWVEFLRALPDGSAEAFTCGVGIRASASARTATAWHFVTPRRVGVDLFLEDDAGPLSRGRLEEGLGADGQVFESATAYKEHVGRALFGLAGPQYDEVLRLLYWLRMPQIGEDIEPAKLAQQLAQALPQLDEQAVKSAGDTFDELTAYGEQIERRAAAAEALAELAGAYAAYARAEVAERARAVAHALGTERRLRTGLKRAEEALAAAEAEREAADTSLRREREGAGADEARIRELEASPEARDQRRLTERAEQADRERAAAAGAADRATKHVASHERKRATLGTEASEIDTELAALVAAVRDLDRGQRESVPGDGIAVPLVLDDLRLTSARQVDGLLAAFDEARGAIADGRVAVSHRLAAIAVIDAALGEHERTQESQRRAESEADRAEQRWEEARQRRGEAEDAADVCAAELFADLRVWADTPNAPGLVLPALLTEESVDALPESTRAAAEPNVERLRGEEQRAATRRDNADAEIDRLTADHVAVAAERDPAPPAPALARTPRPDGRALWQVVDFADGVPDDERAGLEAGLQAAGLLDAWVRPGGRLLNAEHRDIVLAPAEDAPAADDPGTEQTLDGLLRADVAVGGDITADDVRRVLRAIRTGDGGAIAWVGVDGRWRLGPAHGRGAKERAQYVGATARAHERERRLAALDQELARQRGIREEAAATADAAGAEIASLERWLAALPSSTAVRRAWIILGERHGEQGREEGANRAAQQAAREARDATVRAGAELGRLATEHGLPSERDHLAALEQRLRGLDAGLADAARGIPPFAGRLRRWQADMLDLDEDAVALAEEQRDAVAAAQLAAQSEAALETLRASVGATVRELEDRLTALRTSKQQHQDEVERIDKKLEGIVEGLGVAKSEVGHAHDRLADHLTSRAGVLASFAALATPPGLLEAAGVAAADGPLVVGTAALPAAEPVPVAVGTVVARLGALTSDDPVAARNRVWRAHNEASSGPAADHQPVVATFDDLLAVSGRDDAGEAPIFRLAQRVGAAVESDRGLLTEREKQQFEQHVLGELGDAIRRCRVEADELVAAMSGLLGEVTTSQGIRVKLDWKLRDDVAPEVREAVGLLGQPVGALLPEERTTLRDVLHRLIEASRIERPDLSYGEHLGAALDYRTWSEFTIRYLRPEKPGVWEKLHRRSPLSQGEQKVLCYLPLFAAAAAHFTSLAGAAPHAPRLVLLDDAFPKIDVRTHPLLFGLLVQLDLDFVITSERLWGDHETVPSLAIYEALRDPSQRGIAQYEYRWDGRSLRAIG